MAFMGLSIVIPLVQDLAGCSSAEEVANIPAPEKNGLVGFKGSAIFILGPVFQNTILTSNTKNPFELIPIILNEARSFDILEFKTTLVTHADDLNAWLYGVMIGLVPKMRYSVNPDNTEIAKFCMDRHLQCITLNTLMVAGNTAGAVVINSAAVKTQLTNKISLQTKKIWNQTASVAKKLNGRLSAKKRRKTRTRTCTQPSQTCFNVLPPLTVMKRERKLPQHASDSSTPRMLA